MKRPNPVKLAALQAALERDPTLSKAELARRIGVSRATVGYWLRHLSHEVAAAAERKSAVRDHVVATHFDLLDRVAASAAQVQQEIDRLRASGTDARTVRTVFAGHATLNQIHRTLGELLGEIAPPTTNVYVERVNALLAAPIDPASLPEHVRASVR